jgi:hypothetical protein
MKRSIKSQALSVALLLVAAATAQAAQVTVNNFSFEDPDVGGATTWSNMTPPGWQEPVPDGPNSFTEEIGGFASEGLQHEGIQNLSYIFQDLGITAQPLTRYTLTAGVGNRNANFTTAVNNSRMSLLAGGENGTVIATADVNASTVPVGTFADFIAMGATGAVAPTGNLTIRLEVTSPDRAHFDNIRLDAAPVPEPSALGVLGAMSVAVLGLGRRRRTA